MNALYTQAVTDLEFLGIMPNAMPSLEPMKRALDRSGLVSRIDPARSLLVAGTNGKGTTAATLSALIHTTGASVGLYTSPHLVTTRERIRIDEQDLSEEAFVESYRACRAIIREEGLTHFEALTLMSVHAFYSNTAAPPVSWAIWEVGLGGLFDATNAIPHSICAITRLGLDHENLLGRSLTEIARQKFGVIGRDALVVHSPMDASLAPLREETTHATGCRWMEARSPGELGLSTDDLALPGPRALENTATALTLYEALELPCDGHTPRALKETLRQVRWPGRFSALAHSGFPCPVYLSGDHNLQGVESLIALLDSYAWDTLHLVVGIGEDKDAEAMLARLAGLPRAKIYLTETPFKGRKFENYPPSARRQAELQGADVTTLLSQVCERARAGDLVVVTGSLYLVGAVLSSS